MIKVAVGIIRKGDHVLLCQRKETAQYPLKWEFPGGKVKRGESAEDCVQRELREELGITAVVGALYDQQEFDYFDSDSFDVYYYLITSFTGSVANKAFAALEWVPVSMLKSYDILEGNANVVGKLIKEM